MAVLGYSVSKEVGLRLLLCPFGSKIVLRTACCSVGIMLPVYSTLKAIERKDQDEQHKWLMCWGAYGSFSITEIFVDKLISWFPMYYQMKFAFLVWLQLPSVDGARRLYRNHMRPFFIRHQARVDQFVTLAYGEMVCCICCHHTTGQTYQHALDGISIWKEYILKIFRSAGKPEEQNAIEGPADTNSNTESDLEDWYLPCLTRCSKTRLPFDKTNAVPSNVRLRGSAG